MALRYTGYSFVEGTRDEILDLKNGTNLTGSNPDMNTLVPGMCVQITDAPGGIIQLQAVSVGQFAALACQEDGTNNPWKRVAYNIDTDSVTTIS